MISARRFVDALTESGVTFVTGVPDSLLSPLSTAFDGHQGLLHVPAPNEGTAVGLAMGHYVATGQIPVVYLQNSGLGNAVNPLASLLHEEIYGIPLLLIVGWRGKIAESDEPQHRVQGRTTLPLLELLDIPTRVVSSDSDVGNLVDESLDDALRIPGPSALVVEADAIDGPRRKHERDATLMQRIDAIEILSKTVDDRTVVVSTTGKTSRELEVVAAASVYGRFLTIGGMGHASSIALGVSIAHPNRPVVCLDGDGALQMHMGALAMIGGQAPANYLHVLIENGVHESVGGQPLSNPQIDYCRIALACGYASAQVVQTPDDLADQLRYRLTDKGPHLIVVRTRSGSPADLPRPSESPRSRLDRLMQSLGGGITREYSQTHE